MACACRSSLLLRFLPAPFAARTTFETTYRPIGRATRAFASDSSPSDGAQHPPAKPEQSSSSAPTSTARASTTAAAPTPAPTSAAATTITKPPPTDEPLPGNVTFTPAPDSSASPSAAAPKPSPKTSYKLRLRLSKKPGERPADEPEIPRHRRRETWQTQKDALQAKFPLGWSPAKRLSPDALAGIRALHAQFPETYTTPALASLFAISPEAVRRILKSKWTASPEEEEDRRERWVRRGTRVWERWAGMGVKVPHKWRAEGVGVRPAAAGPRWGQDPGDRRPWGEEREQPEAEAETPEEAKAREAREKGENALKKVRARRKLAGKIM